MTFQHGPLVPPKDITTKETNPKDAVGCRKPPLSTVPCQVLFEIGTALLEGACKYGRHNYRIAGVRASIYYDATMRHLMSWWEGENFDPDSGIHHVSKAIAGLVVLRDAMMNDKVQDDRPPSVLNDQWMEDAKMEADVILTKYPNPKPPHTISETLE